MIQKIADGLGPLCKRVVFVGGATTSLYIDDDAAPEPSPSDDVDLVVELTTLQEFNQFENELVIRGFKPPIPHGEEQIPLCRMSYKDIQVDVLPTERKVLGFSNHWFPEGVENKESKTLYDGARIFLFSPAYFLASKLEAFDDRAPDDIRESRDLEDIFAILDGCSKVEESLLKCSLAAKKYVTTSFRKLLKNKSTLLESATGSLGMGIKATQRAEKVVLRIERISEVETRKKIK
jgi:hypothetical protein